MKPERVKQLLACLGVKKAEISGQWMNSPCPLAFATHEKGHDHTPSFGVNIGAGTYNCFSCGASGGLSKLVQEMQFHVGRMKPDKHYDFKTAYAIIDEDEAILEALPEFEEHEAPKVFTPWPEWWTEPYPRVLASDEASTYLLNRGITTDEMYQWDLRWDDDRQMVVFPYRNAFGKLAGARGRCIHKDWPRAKQHHDYKWNDVNNAQLVFYNEQALQLDGPVIVVEGQSDTIKVARYWPKVVGNMTAKIGEPKLKKLSSVGQVLLMLDNDATGQLAMFGNEVDGKVVYPGAAKLLQAKDCQVGVIDYPAEFKDPDKIPDLLLKDLLTALSD